MAAALLIGTPLLTGALLLLLGRRADRLAAPAAIGAAAVMVAFAAVAGATRAGARLPALPGIPFSVAVDGLAAVALLVVTVVGLAVLVFAAADIGAGESRARFFGTMLLFLAAMLVTVTATNLLTLLAAWEIMGATSYALIGFWWQDRQRVAAANTAFLTTRAADLGMYLAAGAVLAGGGADLELAGLAQLAPGWRDVAVAGLVVSALGKSAQLPFSFWLSRAMAGPSPVSALLHSATMVAAGGYLLLRIEPAIAATGWLGAPLAWIGALTALLLGAVAVVQRDMKQLLAASTSSQIGFIVLAAGVGAASGGAEQFAAHAVTKSLLFLVAGAWLTSLGTKDLGELRGAARRQPALGVLLTIGALTLGGVPPLSIWVAKDAILSVALPASTLLYLVGLAAAAVSAAYSAVLILAVWTPRPSPAAPPRPVPLLALAPLPGLALLAAVLGLVAVPPFAGLWAELIPGPAPAEPAVWELAVSGAIAVAVVALVALALRTSPTGVVRPRLLERWLFLETAAVAAGRTTDRAARILAGFDEKVVDRAVQGVAQATAVSARAAGHRGERGVRSAVTGVVAATRRLGAAARRPQTGLVHQYYAQAVVALAALAGLLIVLR